MLSEKIKIINQLGLHARAAAKIVRTASHFESNIKISKDGRDVDGKSIMSVMMLAASFGSEIEISAEGPDESEAFKAIKELILDRFGEEQ